jgi:hypothetical protein
MYKMNMTDYPSLHVHTNYRILLVFYILVTIASSIMNKHHTIRWAKLVRQELLTFPEHLSSPLCFSGICVTWSLVLCVCFVDRCLSFCTFSFGHCVVCPTLIYELWLPLWCLLISSPVLLTSVAIRYILATF